MSVLSPYFKIDAFSLFIGGFVIFFYALTVLYSASFMKGGRRLTQYHALLLLTAVSSLGVVFSNHLVVFLGCWGFIGLLLYLLIGFGLTERTPATAKKTLIIVGGTDALMMLGLALIYHLTGSFQMSGAPLPLDSKLACLAYVCLAAGALAKAGAMPFHSWVPDTAVDAPIPVTAFLPASLDKLLGIYFLARLTLEMFAVIPLVQSILMIMGGLTIVFAVMMALVQHDLKRLLGYHAVSQVGYMVLGIGCGNPIAVAGGLFHMLNNAIYKSCLFFAAGAVEKNTGTSDLDKLGGLAKVMPVTFGVFTIAALAISGVPPFNGFASKWMIYQGLIESSKNGNGLGLLMLVAAMFGSALTLASFLKILHAVFLGLPASKPDLWNSRQQDPSPLMWGPMAALAVLCVVFGVAANMIPLKFFIYPSLGSPVVFSGLWSPGVATGLLVFSLLLGFPLYYWGRLAKTRITEPFVGGEVLSEHREMRVSGVEFYHTIQNLWPLKSIYAAAEKRRLDPYNIAIRMSAGVTALLRHLHNGVLPTYLAWCLLGGTVLLLYLLR